MLADLKEVGDDDGGVPKMNPNDVPAFGNMEGVKVAFHGVNVAAPFAAELMAENGATVIEIENARNVDQARGYLPPFVFLNERKNILDLTLDLSGDAGKRVLKRLLKDVDIFFEGNKGGTYEKWGLSDEDLWKVNPRLVIVHVSGFGQTGDPEYIRRPAFDAVAQSFGGWMYLNGNPAPEPPIKGPSFIGDYASALFACSSALMAYIGAQRTGVGESIDVAMVDCLWKIQGLTSMSYFLEGEVPPRLGNGSPASACVDNIACKDGEFISLSCTGAAAVQRAIKFFGLQDDPLFPPDLAMANKGTEEGARLRACFDEYCAKHDAMEAETEFVKAGIPASCVYNIRTIQSNSHIKAREVFVEWNDPVYGTVKGLNAVPKMKNRPAKFWRGAPAFGMDDEGILSSLGFSDQEIGELREQGVIATPDETGGYRYKR